MESYIFKPSCFQNKALNIAFRVLSISDARNWITRLSSDTKNLRLVIKAAGILGDPHAVEWLILKMREAKHARLAAESFTMITGIDLVQHGLTQAPPDNYEPLPSENTNDGSTEMDEDENLPWPNPALIGSSWKSLAGQLVKGQRYFLGKEINAGNLSMHIQHACQRQRHNAAMELALSDVSKILQNTCTKVSQG